MAFSISASISGAAAAPVVASPSMCDGGGRGELGAAVSVVSLLPFLSRRLGADEEHAEKSRVVMGRPEPRRAS